jgi:hypothetical protein
MIENILPFSPGHHSVPVLLARPQHPDTELYRMLQDLLETNLRDMIQGHLRTWHRSAFPDVYQDPIPLVNLPAARPAPVEENEKDLDRFPADRRVIMPARSCLVSTELMQEQIAMFSKREYQWKRATIGEFSLNFNFWSAHHSEEGLPRFLRITESSQILRVYGREDVYQKRPRGDGTLFGAECEIAAASNFNRIRNGTITPEKLPEVIAEIENQLNYVPREQPVKKYKNRSPVKKIFMRYEAWKKAQEA